MKSQPLSSHGTASRSATAMAREVRLRLVEVGGRTSQDLGLGRIVGQMLVYLYLWDGDCSLDQIGEELGLSKAAVSIAARQLENLGLIRRAWKQGDRRKYYRTVENIGVALRQGLLSLVRNKMEALAGELDSAYATIAAGTQGEGDAELRFLTARVRRAKVLRDRMVSVLGSPLLKLLLPGKS